MLTLQISPGITRRKPAGADMHIWDSVVDNTHSFGSLFMAADNMSCVWIVTPYTWAEKFESFERINSIRETNGNFDSCNSCKRLGTSRLHELHESKFPFVSRIEFIRSKLSNFSAHVYGVSDAMQTFLLIAAHIFAGKGSSFKTQTPALSWKSCWWRCDMTCQTMLGRDTACRWPQPTHVHGALQWHSQDISRH